MFLLLLLCSVVKKGQMVVDLKESTLLCEIYCGSSQRKEETVKPTVDVRNYLMYCSLEKHWNVREKHSQVMSLDKCIPT